MRASGAERYRKRMAERDERARLLLAEKAERTQREEQAVKDRKSAIAVVPPVGISPDRKALRGRDPRAVGKDTSGVWYTEDDKVITCAWCSGVGLAATSTRIKDRPYCAACLGRVPDDEYLRKRKMPIYSLALSWTSWRTFAPEL